MKNNRKGLSVRTMIAIMGGVTLVLIAIFGLSYYRNYQRKQEIQQARIEREKQRKRDEIHFHTQVKEDLKKVYIPTTFLTVFAVLIVNLLLTLALAVLDHQFVFW